MDPDCAKNSPILLAAAAACSFASFAGSMVGVLGFEGGWGRGKPAD